MIGQSEAPFLAPAGDHDVAALAGVDPRNPFATAAYGAARRSLGDRVVATGLPGGAAALGFERVGWMRRVLDLPSIPVLDQDDGYWDALVEAVRRRGITRVDLNSYGAIGGRLPARLELTRRWGRAEHLVDLGKPDLLAGCHRTHRQRVRQAGREGCSLEWRRDPDAVIEHARLIGASMERRQGGGAAVVVTPSPIHRTLLASGAAELALVRRNGEVIASTLVLLAPDGGYLHSSGSDATGKSIGAHHFMVLGVATRLQGEGKSILNLGGTRDDERGLREFKNHFGAEEVAADAGTLEADRLGAKLGASAQAVLTRLRLSRNDR